MCKNPPLPLPPTLGVWRRALYRSLLRFQSFHPSSMYEEVVLKLQRRQTRLHVELVVQVPSPSVACLPLAPEGCGFPCPLLLLLRLALPLDCDSVMALVSYQLRCSQLPQCHAYFLNLRLLQLLLRPQAVSSGMAWACPCCSCSRRGVAGVPLRHPHPPHPPGLPVLVA